MELTQDEVLMILKIVKEADVGFLDLQIGDLRLVLSKDALDGVPAATAPARASAGEVPSASAAAPTAAQATAPPAPAAGPQAAAPAATAQPAAPPAPSPAEEGLVGVPAPMVGVFYSRPEPSAPPFVQPGDTVDAETTVGLIEVMKVFNAVKAGTGGRVERILAEDGQFVEFGQDLMLVRPVE